MPPVPNNDANTAIGNITNNTNNNIINLPICIPPYKKYIIVTIIQIDKFAKKKS